MITRDVTARKATDDEKTAFLTDTAHELLAPLPAMKAALHKLTRRGAKLSATERTGEYARLRSEHQRLEHLVYQLLYATSLEQVDLAVVTGELDWASLVAEQVASVRGEEPDRTISMTVAPDLPPVLGDDQLASQVLANLLSNAVKFSPPGSPVEVEAVLARERVVTTVTDYGSGVPRADRERVFEKFAVGDVAGGASFGAGLGLYIVRRSVEAMGGRVWIDEAEGGGAAVTFSLPAVEVNVAPDRVRIR